MPKEPLSVTLDADNLLWLRARVAAGGGRSLSDAIDAIVTAARTGGLGAPAPRSVVGTIDIAPDDETLEKADLYLQHLVDQSLARPVLVRETKPEWTSKPKPRVKPDRG